MRRLLLPLFVLASISGLLLAACGSPEVEEKAKTTQEIIDDIHQSFVEAEYLSFELTTEQLPSDVNGIKNAIGQGNRSPAFTGTIDLINAGSTVGAEVRAVDGEVWALTGLNPDFLLIDPAAIDAPDPAQLVGTGDNGLVAIFGQASDLDSSGKSREGNLVLETITGTVPGELLASLLPTASDESDFSVEFRVTEKGDFHDLRLTGEFYAGHETTYRLKMEISEEAVVVTKPVD